jgi:ketosteroid isomerase-like protein
MHDGDLDAIMTLYEPEAVFVNQATELSSGPEMLRSELASFAAARATFEFTSIQIIQADDIALMHTAWNVSGPPQLSVYAIEVARRQADGTWLTTSSS